MTFDTVFDLAVRTLVVVACLSISLAGICRVNLLKGKEHKWTWIALNVCMAGFACGLALGVLAGSAVGYHEVFGLAAFLLYIGISMDNWRRTPPRLAQKHQACPPTQKGPRT